MRGATYRLEVEGELSNGAGLGLADMSLQYDHGNTVLVGPIRDQAELTVCCNGALISG
ncbi:MAG: hypothetical protein ACLP22_11230 [Solirubrobacteraceae bacterium]